MDDQTYKVIEKLMVLRDDINKHIDNSNDMQRDITDILQTTLLVLKRITVIEKKLFDHIDKEEVTLELTAQVLSAFQKTRKVIIWIGGLAGAFVGCYSGYILLMKLISGL